MAIPRAEAGPEPSVRFTPIPFFQYLAMKFESLVSYPRHIHHFETAMALARVAIGPSPKRTEESFIE
jgi:hypothetical protein